LQVAAILTSAESTIRSAARDNPGIVPTSNRTASARRTQEPAERPRVALADDDILLREGLAGLLERGGFEVVGQAGTAPELLELVRAQRPELVIVDIRMPPGHTTEGLDAARVIREEQPRRRFSSSRRTSRSSRRRTCSRAASGPATS
jgi:CheY-like chemotaxis protein